MSKHASVPPPLPPANDPSSNYTIIPLILLAVLVIAVLAIVLKAFGMF